MEFHLSCFKSWKMMLWKCCTQYAIKFGKLGSGHRTGKGQFSFQSKKSNAKEYSNYHTIALISHTGKVMLENLQARLQQYMNHDVHAGFRKGRGTRDQIANIRWIIEKARKFKKNIYFCFIGYTKAFDCVKSENESHSAASDSLSVLSDSFCTVRGILQASILEWVAFPFSKGSSQFRGQTLHCRRIPYQLSYQGSS